MLLQLLNVNKVYGTRHILKNINIEICSGSITLLTGANGSGKSTLLKLMAGLSKPTSGSVIYTYQTNTLGYLGHDSAMYPGLSAKKNLTFWAALHHYPISKEAILTMLKRVELIHFADEQTKTFSRGMLQRLNLARVLMLRPNILLLDEPCTGLDTHSKNIFYKEIQQAKAEGSGIMWISHDIIKDADTADQLLVLKDNYITYRDLKSENII